MISSINSSGNVRPSVQNTEHHCFRLLVGAQVPQSEYSLHSEGLWRCSRYIFGRTHKAGEWYQVLDNPRDGCSHGHLNRKSEQTPTRMPSERCNTALQVAGYEGQTDWRASTAWGTCHRSPTPAVCRKTNPWDP